MPCASSLRVGLGLVFRNPTAAMMKPDMQNAHWNPCSSMTPCCTGCSVPSGLASPSMVRLSVAHGMGQHRAGIVRHIVDQHGAGAAFGAVAPSFVPVRPSL